MNASNSLDFPNQEVMDDAFDGSHLLLGIKKLPIECFGILGTRNVVVNPHNFLCEGKE